MKRKNIRLGEVLVDSGYLTEQQLGEALNIQKTSGGKKLGDILIESGIITEEQLTDALHRRLNVPLIDLKKTVIPPEVLKLIPEDFARKKCMIPVRTMGDAVVVAMNDPLNYYAIDDFEMMTGRTAVPNIATRYDINYAIDKYFASSTAQSLGEDASEQIAADAAMPNLDFSDAELRASSTPVVKLVNNLVEQAYKRRASDIHIEPGEFNIRVRMRIDGDLSEVMTMDSQLLGPVIARIKLTSGLNIAEKRLPQDGRMMMDMEDGVKLNLRVSTISTVYGEKVVLRLLADSTGRILSIEELGLNEHNIKKLYALMKSPSGIVLVTGPTGSGKSTTLYALLSYLAKPEVNIVTIEDPVEKVVAGVNQTQINAKAGLTFAAGLRSFLRQDPDIIMVGEIRDEETADIASAAAITGHLVLSSLHTNDAAGAYMRFVDMGIQPYIVASSIVGVVAQRLVKRICPHCKAAYDPVPEERSYLDFLGVPAGVRLWQGRGCARCAYTGYLGRTAIYEIIPTDNTIRDMIIAHERTQAIEKHLKTTDFESLRDNALAMVLAGETTFKEMIARTYSVESGV